MWVGNLLVGGGIGAFIDASPNRALILNAYNSAWSSALSNKGYAMDTSASAFTEVTVSGCRCC
jgi:hypothetical protein